jgi:hypothetical protein
MNRTDFNFLKLSEPGKCEDCEGEVLYGVKEHISSCEVYWCGSCGRGYVMFPRQSFSTARKALWCIFDYPELLEAITTGW